MNSTELATISRYRFHYTIGAEQSLPGNGEAMAGSFFNRRYSHSSLGQDVDFVKLAEAYNIKAFRIDNNQQVEEVLRSALELNEPVLIECDIHPDDKVYPIVPPGLVSTA